MTPIDLILWALAAAVAVLIVGLPLAVVVTAMRSAFGRGGVPKTVNIIDHNTPTSAAIQEATRITGRGFDRG